MTGSTKILTVSYGTFSCTLEGFDDPFGTMRQIAEYFRDLAADDRYFGAEPPTPDVEMLQSIAARDAQRRVEARMSETGVALQVTAEAPAPAETQAPKPVSRPVSKPATRPVAEAEPAEPDSGPLTFDDDFLMADEPDDVLAVDPLAKPQAEGPAESVAEKLRRIRAVVSRSIEPEETTGSFSQRQALSADGTGEARRDRAKTRTIQEISEDLSDDEEAGFAQPATAEAAAEEAVEAPDYAREVVTEAEAPALEIAAAEDEYPEAEASFDADADMIFEEAATEEPEGEKPAGDGWEWSEDAEEEIRADETAAAVSVEDEETDEETDDERVKNSISAVLGRLSEAPEAEARKTSDVLQLGVPVSSPAPVSQRRISRPLAPISEASEDVGRLLAETDSKLNEDDTVRRRRVISQMRAAVAATKADRLMSRRVVSKEAEDEAEQGPYRHDLSEAVRDVTTPLPSERAPISRKTPPPLVLVSSQRIDTPKMVRPEMPQIQATDRPSGGGFARYAENMGAKDLTELLEAAAAYTSFVEGQPSFTRPEIMKRVARVDPTIRLSREESLRSFGQLLRQGKFRKLERGQFTIAKDTRFHPDQRVAGE